MNIKMEEVYDDATVVDLAETVVSKLNRTQLSNENAQAFGYPVGCPIWYNFDSRSNCCDGTIESVWMDTKSRKLVFKVEDSSTEDIETIEISQGLISYGDNCPVWLNENGNEEICGKVVGAKPIIGEDGKMSGIESYSLVLFLGGAKRRLREDVPADLVAYRCTDVATNSTPNIMKLSDENAKALGYPLSCPVQYNFEAASVDVDSGFSYCDGVIKSVFMDTRTRKLEFEVENSISKKAERIPEGLISYMNNCPVWLKRNGSEEIRGKVFCSMPIFEGGMMRGITYRVILGGIERKHVVTAPAGDVKYRFVDIESDGKAGKSYNDGASPSNNAMIMESDGDEEETSSSAVVDNDSDVAPGGLGDSTMVADIDRVTTGEVSSEAGKPPNNGEGTVGGDGEENASSSGTEDGVTDVAEESDDGSGNDDEEAAAVVDEKAVALPNADAVTAGDQVAEDTAESSSNKNEQSSGSDEEEEDELWELKMVLKPSQILQAGAMQCATDGCDLVACCIWSSNLDPETPWYSCLDCQANDFEGWPQNKKEIPIKVLSDELREAMLEKCTRLAEPDLPDLPSGANAAAKSKEEATTTEEDKTSDDDHSCKESEEEGEDWNLTKIFNVDELARKMPIMCSYTLCYLVACSRWESKGEDPWYCCLDCQEDDYGGWPEEKKELPVDFLTEENRQLIAEKCSAREDPPMPNLPTAMALLTSN